MRISIILVVVMQEKDELRIIPILRRLALALDQEKGYSGSDLEKAKALATKLYVMHTNRELTLNSNDFQVVLDILEFDS